MRIIRPQTDAPRGFKRNPNSQLPIHVSVGIEGYYEPTPEELKSFKEAFLSAGHNDLVELPMGVDAGYIIPSVSVSTPKSWLDEKIQHIQDTWGQAGEEAVLWYDSQLTQAKKFEKIIHTSKGKLRIEVEKIGWDPTPEEMDELCETFKAAFEMETGAVVVTTCGIYCDFIAKEDWVASFISGEEFKKTFGVEDAGDLIDQFTASDLGSKPLEQTPQILMSDVHHLSELASASEQADFEEWNAVTPRNKSQHAHKNGPIERYEGSYPLPVVSVYTGPLPPIDLSDDADQDAAAVGGCGHGRAPGVPCPHCLGFARSYSTQMFPPGTVKEPPMFGSPAWVDMQMKEIEDIQNVVPKIDDAMVPLRNRWVTNYAALDLEADTLRKVVEGLQAKIRRLATLTRKFQCQKDLLFVAMKKIAEPQVDMNDDVLEDAEALDSIDMIINSVMARVAKAEKEYGDQYKQLEAKDIKEKAIEADRKTKAKAMRKLDREGQVLEL